MLLAATRPAEAQNGSVAGHVADQTGGVLPGVMIELADAKGEHTAVTNDAGAFRFDRVTPGRVELTYRLINFAVLRKTVMVAEGPVTAADAVLTLALNADVVVTGASTFRTIADVANPAENLV